MERQLERCAGLDVHRDTVAACVRVPGRGGHREQHVRTFGRRRPSSFACASGWKSTG